MSHTELKAFRVLKVVNQNTLKEGFVIQAEDNGKHVYYNCLTFAGNHIDCFSNNLRDATIMFSKKFADDIKQAIESKSVQECQWKIVDEQTEF